MTFLPYRGRSKDVQDHVERHVWGDLEYHDAGSIIKVRGTDTDDEEATVLNIAGVNFKLKKDSDAEVFLVASSSDTNLKVAILTIPHDKQRRWKEGDGGVQHPTDPEFALDFSDKLAHITKNKFGVGADGEFEIKEKEAYFRVKKLIVDGELIVNKRVITPEVVAGKEPPPGFEGNKQEEKKKSNSSSGGGGSSSPTPTQMELDFGDAG